MSIRPMARGLMLCERVIVEEGTKNVSPINVFVRRHSDRFPTLPMQFDVFALLVGGQGEVDLAVRISRGDSLELILIRSGRVAFTNPLQEVRLIRRIGGCVFPASGKYQVDRLAGGELIALTTFEVVQVEYATCTKPTVSRRRSS